ncbi:hypothetical protein [Streptomyces sp. S.PNR 29]|uniref:hypothetical protein n=1 Tax=Streptomyces sp. S.PNR 29 TaxID=2973805 RepID=UPI0025B19509|nr:hypothetical protein [Streptomyces sp. S.PNR 29]MDN0199390.1 hypothetical protein [Streptomyces sp. S.PNR 29]
MTAPHQRSARSGRDLRILRAAVFAAVCVVLAATGHALASCATVPLWTVGAGFLGTIVVAAPLTGRERSLPATAALLAVGQTVLHTLFGLGQHGTAAVQSTGAVSKASLVEQAARLMCGTSAAEISPAQARKILTDAQLYPAPSAGAAHHPADAMSTTAGSSVSLLPSLPMLLGHVLAAIAAGWLLRRGDLALARLVELSAQSAHTVAEGALVRSLRGALALVRALHTGLPAALGSDPHLPRTALPAPPRPRTTALQHTVIRRGPPASALTLAA